MTSTTSGTTTFTLDVDDIIEQALEPIGGQIESGIEAFKARRVLNLILIQLQNKNIPLHKLNTVTYPLTAHVNNITLDPVISDVLQLNILQTTDGVPLSIPIERYSEREFHEIPLKKTEQRPSVWTTDRLLSNVIVNFWPVPPDDTYSAEMLVIQKIEDITASYQKVEVPYRYYPLLVKWLAYELSLIRQNVDSNGLAYFQSKINLLKQEYQECLMDTEEEDRERADFHVVPGGISGR